MSKTILVLCLIGTASLLEGQITTASDPRILQVSMKLIF